MKNDKLTLENFKGNEISKLSLKNTIGGGPSQPIGGNHTEPPLQYFVDENGNIFDQYGNPVNIVNPPTGTGDVKP